MTIFEANISPFLIDFFKTNLPKIESVEAANIFLAEVCGIQSFFQNAQEMSVLSSGIKEHIPVLKEPDRRAYGDFQTNQALANSVVEYLVKKGKSPEFLLEPTCGKGRFIIAALDNISTLKKVIGIEIYYPYVWETKFSILEYYLKNKHPQKPQIEIIHEDIFNLDLATISQENNELESLIIGNPPWVTSAELSKLDSKNLPQKSNFKNHKGIDAFTGKGNFDIAEYITLQLLKHFAQRAGTFAFLVKNSVVKNILVRQKESEYDIGNIQKLNINAKKEFNVSVDACLFLADLDSVPAFTCQEIDFYTKEYKTTFGWYEHKFVHSITDYRQVESIDGKCAFVWRQGMKHDCSKIMELDRSNGHYVNGFKQAISLEKDLLFGILKSSDLKHEVIDKYRKTTIVTQKKVGQNTNYIKRDYPQIYDYLNTNRAYFDRRKSSIYKGKPPFSIFGIGDYSFAKYKVAISGMYKRTTFSLVLPENGKPLMLDDTCYFIGFNCLEHAQIAQKILNSNTVQKFLKAIIFLDAKRPITKDILMRIDMQKAYNLLQLNKEVSADCKAFGDLLEPSKKATNQMTLF